MWTLTWKNLRAHKRRLIATCFAVLLGVSFLSATLATGDTMRQGFGKVITDLNAGTDAVVRSTTDIGNNDVAAERGLVDQSLADRLRGVDGVASAALFIDKAGQVIGANGKPVGGGGPPTRAGNYVDDPGLSGYRLDRGRAPAAADEVVLDRGTADRGKLHVGDHTVVRVPQPVKVTIVGIVKFGAYDSIGASTWVGFTTDRAAELLLGHPGMGTEIGVAAAAGISEADLVERIRPMLADGLEARTGAQIEAEYKQDLDHDFINFFETFLLVFAGIALLVATFSIYNTFSIIVAQRTRESALLRALGASRRQVLRSITLEAFVVGLIASALGLAAGVGIAHGIAALLESMNLDLPVGIVIGTRTIVVSMAVGIGVTLLASVAPAIRASRVAPLAALREVSIDRSDRSVVRGVIGLVAAAGGVLLVLDGSEHGALGRAGLGAVAALTGMVLLGPVVARPVSAILGAPIAVLRRQPGRLARRNAMRNPRRTAASASALMVGVAVVTLFTVLAASIKESIASVADESVSADLVVDSGNFSGIGLDPQMAGRIAALPEVRDVVDAGDGVVQLGGKTVYPTLVDTAAMPKIADMEVQQGSLEGVGPTGLAVHDKYAADHGWTLGSQVPVHFGDGQTVTFTVDAIYGLGNLFGDILMPRAAYTAHATQVSDAVVLMRVAEGVSFADAKAAVQHVVDEFYGPDVQDRNEYIDSVNAQIDQALALVYGLLGLAILIAVMGIANTISLAVHERRRELGLLRAVGQTRRQTRTMVRWESVMVSLFGTLGGVVLGTFLGWGMVRAIGEQEGIGTFAVPTSQLTVVLALGAAAGVVAALRPARRAARLDVLTAIAAS
jgi:putative ABC transport system permease protein